MRTFGFIKDWELSIYAKMCRYFQYCFKSLSIPFEVFGNVQDLRQRMDARKDLEMLVFLPFDALCQRCEQEIPQIARVNYIYFVTEPDHNIDSVMKFCTPYMSSIYATLNLNMNQKELLAARFPTQLHFTCFQGYFPEEDLKHPVSVAEKTVDVVAPGFAGSSEYRRNVVQKLREKGLVVRDESVFGSDFDAAVRRAKVVIAVPFDERYNIWYGQRTLWPLNKQTCVVTIPSADSLAEEFYNGLFITTSYNKMADDVANVIATEKWKTFGPTAYERFKNDFFCLDVLDDAFYRFCCDWTETPVK